MAAVLGTQSGILAIFSWGNWGDMTDRFIGHPQSVESMCKVDEVLMYVYVYVYIYEMYIYIYIYDIYICIYNMYILYIFIYIVYIYLYMYNCMQMYVYVLYEYIPRLPRAWAKFMK